MNPNQGNDMSYGGGGNPNMPAYGGGGNITSPPAYGGGGNPAPPAYGGGGNLTSPPYGGGGNPTPPYGGGGNPEMYGGGGNNNDPYSKMQQSNATNHQSYYGGNTPSPRGSLIGQAGNGPAHTGPPPGFPGNNPNHLNYTAQHMWNAGQGQPNYPPGYPPQNPNYGFHNNAMHNVANYMNQQHGNDPYATQAVVQGYQQWRNNNPGGYNSYGQKKQPKYNLGFDWMKIALN